MDVSFGDLEHWMSLMRPGCQEFQGVFLESFLWVIAPSKFLSNSVDFIMTWRLVGRLYQYFGTMAILPALSCIWITVSKLAVFLLTLVWECPSLKSWIQCALLYAHPSLSHATVQILVTALLGWPPVQGSIGGWSAHRWSIGGWSAHTGGQ